MSEIPNGYKTPKTDWNSSTSPLDTDLNRWEGNSKAIEEGNRTVDPAQVPASNIGTLRNFLNWFPNMIKRITGKTNWYDAPATTLESTKAHIDAVAPHTGHETPTGAQDKVDIHANKTNNPHNVTTAQVTHIGTNTHDNSVHLSSYPLGASEMRVSSTTAGFPATYGTLTTHKSSDDYGYQFFNDRLGAHDVFYRASNGATTWTPWRKLWNENNSDSFNNAGTYASLRAQATTKADVGLGLVPNVDPQRHKVTENDGLAHYISSQDLNTKTSTGFYRGNSVTNAPDANWYYFEVISHHTSSWVVQYATRLHADIMYVRRLEGGTWKPWVEITNQRTKTGQLKTEVVSSFPAHADGKIIAHTGDKKAYVSIGGEWV